MTSDRGQGQDNEILLFSIEYATSACVCADSILYLNLCMSLVVEVGSN